MAGITLSDPLRAEYQRLFDTCSIGASRASAVETLVSRIVAHRARYDRVATLLGVPWHLIGVIHAMESSLNFRTHLHNGDPLTARTRQAPAGRPLSGNPPFTWEESAIDALQLERLHQWTDWSAPGTLYKLEKYNGFGYRRLYPHVLTPYLWSFSNHYTRGKFVADGRFSDTAVSQQCGAAVLLRRMAERSVIDVAEALPPSPTVTIPRAAGPLLRFAPNRVNPYGKELQAFLNKLPNIYLKEDGKLGERTSNAFREATGRYLDGDPRS
jgi:lysozyme family protein